MSETRKEIIEQIQRKFPTLKYSGFERADEDLREWSSAMVSERAIKEYSAACNWLARQNRTKHPNGRNGTSYGLKSYAEADEGQYISNGMFIAAAIALDFRIKIADGGPNALLNISSVLVRQDHEAIEKCALDKALLDSQTEGKQS